MTIEIYLKADAMRFSKFSLFEKMLRTIDNIYFQGVAIRPRHPQRRWNTPCSFSSDNVRGLF